jgi:hypothetical protein
VFENTKALLIFAVRFFLIFFFILPLWFLITPAYNRLLASGANVLLAQIEHPRVTTLVGWERNIAIVRSDIPFRRGRRIQGFTGYLTHFNLMLLAALVLASRQIAWRHRIKVLGIGLGLLYILHVLYLLVGVKFFQHLQSPDLETSVGNIYVWGVNFYLSIASQLFPVLIWMALYRRIARTPEQKVQSSGGATLPEAERVTEGAGNGDKSAGGEKESRSDLTSE